MDMHVSVIDGETTPSETWDALQADDDTALVDVRTHAEWSFVGAPDLSSIGKPVLSVEWRRYPTMEINSDFVEELTAAVSSLRAQPRVLYFVCRSGARSREAAAVMRAHYRSVGVKTLCVNVAEGFEGDLDVAGHRSAVNGWQACSLPWRQS